MLDGFVVRRCYALPDEIDSLADESRAEGFRFVERLRDEWRSGANRFEGVGEAFFVAERAASVAGVCGLNRDPFEHDAHCGRLRRLYVRADQRRLGLASALTQAALAAAREHFTHLRLRTDDPAADRFYRALGFSRSSEEHATHVIRLQGND